MADGPKENANPVVITVDTTALQKSKTRSVLQEWPELAAISADPGMMLDEYGSNQDYFWDFQSDACYTQWKEPHRSINERSVLLALSDASAATDGKASNILRNAGLVIPETSDEARLLRENFLKFPTFIPVEPDFISKNPKRTGQTKSSSSKEVSTNDSREKWSILRDVLEPEEVFDLIRHIQDPEHPLTLEQLSIVSPQQIEVYDRLDHASAPGTASVASHDTQADRSRAISSVLVRFTPTIPHCSMATLIGLCIRVKLMRSLPPRIRVLVKVEQGTHQSEQAINRQLADKERVFAALENKHLRSVVDKCIAHEH